MIAKLRPRLLLWVAGLALLLALIAGGVWLVLFRVGPDPYAVAGFSPEERYKYGSIGSEPTNGVPYWIWRVLPDVFAEELPGGYEQLGFVWEAGRDTPVGVPKRDIGIVPRVGINCATCHVGTVRLSPSEDQPRIVPGGASPRMDIQSYQRFLVAASESPKFTGDVLIPAIKQVHEMSWPEEALYRFVLIPGTKLALAQANEQNAWMDRNPDWGPGRIDPFNPVKFGILEQSVDQTIGNSDMMPNWNLAQRDGTPLHWDGLSTSVREVILSSALGDGTPPEVLDLVYMEQLQQYLEQLQPPSYPLPIDAGLAERGQAVFAAECGQCHARSADRPPRLISAAELGVDQHRLEMWGSKDADAYIQRYASYDWRFTRFQNEDQYLAPPTEGLWLRGPYLHNGSVPTVADLLEPPERRPTQFYRGDDVFDPVRFGFRSDRDHDPETGIPFFAYDTRLPGNSNEGHTYGTSLNSADKQALIEFLKTQ